MTGNEALLALIQVFTTAGFPYMVVGSYSSNFWGIPKSTKDADLVVHVSPEIWKELPALLPNGIELDDQTSLEMVTSTRSEILRVEGSAFEIELFRLGEDLFDHERFSRRVSEEIFSGVPVSLPTAEDVIVQKLRWSAAAKRPKDFSDVVTVMQMQWEKIDWDYITKWCSQHGTLGELDKAKKEASGA